MTQMIRETDQIPTDVISKHPKEKFNTIQSEVKS